MNTCGRSRKEIDKLDWKEAIGVKYTGIQTNSMLTKRDYNIKCQLDYCIDIVHGIWVWFCTAHHQPSLMCKIGRLEEHINCNVLIILRRKEDDV